MKSFGIIILAFAISILNVSCGQEGKSMTVKTEIYCDHCEECESCKARVETALNGTEGVQSADMKVSDKTITVNYDPSKTDEQKIKTAIAQTGFDAGDVKADPAAYDNLDDCCKKK
jgi:copper chaperone CopZ